MTSSPDEEKHFAFDILNKAEREVILFININ